MDTLLVVFIAACVLSIMYCVWIVSAASVMNNPMINAYHLFRKMQTAKNEMLKSLDFVLKETKPLIV